MSAIDLRSDTVTRPTAGMLEAMAAAETGDDVYAEDPTVLALEQRVAELLGHEAGLFTVTGSLANVLGVAAHVAPGQELLCESRAHIVRAELGAHAATSGVTTRTWQHPSGGADLRAIELMLAPDAGPHLVSTAAVALENTHNFAGGTVLDQADVKGLVALLEGTGVALHLDGARLWNAHAVTGVPLAEYAQAFDTVSVCLSKGLGAPVGSVLVGSKRVIESARTRRKRAGAGWRQAGVLAAAGLYALDHHLARLADDHRHAAQIAAAVAAAAPSVVDSDAVSTNIVLLDTTQCHRSTEQIIADTAAQGVRVSAVGPHTIRVMTHLDVSTEDAQQAAMVLADVLGTA